MSRGPQSAANVILMDDDFCSIVNGIGELISQILIDILYTRNTIRASTLINNRPLILPSFPPPFLSPVASTEEGRVLFDNLTKTIAYTLTHLLPELFSIVINILFSIPYGMSR